MKIIFLDFDGVITTPSSKYCLSPPHMDILGKILESTGAYIVISSSWRRYNLEQTINFITSSSNPFVGENPFPFTDKVIDITKRLTPIKMSEYIYRGDEIKEWLDNNEVESYVILDDINNMLSCQQNNLVLTDEKKGLIDKDAQKAIRILNENKEKRYYNNA